MSHVEVTITSASNADDLGLLALRDVAAAAEGCEYVVIGGHMVRLLAAVYQLPAQDRLTADADAGIAESVALGGHLHEQLTGGGYVPASGNRYIYQEAPPELGKKQDQRIVDLLVPKGADGGIQVIGDRGFDGAPGLRRALAQPKIEVAVQAHLLAGPDIAFLVPIPDVEAAFVLKMLAWSVRFADKDIRDLRTLLEIVESGPAYLGAGWTLHDRPEPKGELGDAIRAARQFVTLGKARRVEPRLRALLAKHISCL